MSKSLPPGWRRVRLGDVLEQVNRFEKLDPGREYRLLGVKWYAQGVFEREAKFGKAIAAKQRNRVEEGDFVYNRLFAWKGSFAVVGNEHAGGYVSGEFPVFRAKPDAILAEFLYRHFSRPEAWRLIEHHSTGTTKTWFLTSDRTLIQAAFRIDDRGQPFCFSLIGLLQEHFTLPDCTRERAFAC